jgi:hypothetical protein
MSQQGAGVLFVCMGNICRSPTAEGVFRHLLAERRQMDRFKVDSAGTHGYHIGRPPDRRAARGVRKITARPAPPGETSDVHPGASGSYPVCFGWTVHPLLGEVRCRRETIRFTAAGCPSASPR